MAVRLACPACGKAFAPKPADAGRVIPCARCGSDLQMPAAAPPAAPKPVARPVPPESDESEPEPATRRRGRGGLLLGLVVLLASGVVGTFTGAAVFYFALRERPAPGPVAQKPPDAGTVTVPPNTEPPKVEPKAEPPKVEPKVGPKIEAKVEPPKVVPPKPKDPVVAPGVPGGLVAADALPGLKFYLSCDTLTDGKVTEAVSGKLIGTGVGLGLVDGRRGKALRLTHDRKNANRHALDLTDARDRFAIPAERPFTLCLWARRVHADANSGFGSFLFDATTEHKALHARSLYLQLLPGAAQALAAVSLLDMSNRGDPGTAKSASPMGRVADPTEWTHFALVRDDAGKTYLLVNGAPAPDARPAAFPGELRYDTIGLLRSSEAKAVVDVDELCLFDRVLTDNELGALTGLKIAPRPKDVIAEVKPLPPGAVPAAAEFKGLKFYLPCDAVADGSLTEAVSGKNVGKGRKLELVEGARGKAVRVGAGGPGGVREGFDLSGHADALALGEGKPFTLALWVRADDWDTPGVQFVHAQFGAPDDTIRFFYLYRYTRGFGFLLQQGKRGGRASPVDQLARGTHELAPTKGWVHLAMTRDEKGAVRMHVNGEVAATAVGLFTADARFDGFSLVHLTTGAFTGDIDEFCLFDRVLTDAELARLAGRKPKEGPAVAVGPKDPPVVAPKDPPPAIAPKDPPAPLEVAPPPRIAAVAEPPVVVAPKAPAAPLEVSISAPVGVDPKGLLLYLPFDEVRDGQMREGVSGKFAGKCEGVELVNGPRGRAARLAGEAARLDFGDLAERTNVAEGKPFTLALWFRIDPREPGAKASGTAVQFGVRPDREYDRALQIGFGAAGTLHGTARSTPDRLDPKRETAARWAGVANPAKFLHVATVRDEKNVVKWYVNGKPAPQPGKPDPVWDGPLGFDRIFIGDPEQAKAILEVDELCLFERALTADELKKLSEPTK